MEILMRITTSIAILASCISVSAAAQGSPPPTKGSQEPEVTHINFEGSALDIAWTRDQHVYEKTLEIPSNLAWSAYPNVFADLRIDPNIINSDQMVFGSAAYHRNTLGKKRLSHYFECGNMLGVSTADSYDVWVRVISQVLPLDGGLSTVRTQVEATARVGDRMGETVRCSSTGLLESQITKLLTEEAAKLQK
jgi:hypothetical protein